MDKYNATGQAIQYRKDAIGFGLLTLTICSIVLAFGFLLQNIMGWALLFEYIAFIFMVGSYSWYIDYNAQLKN